MFPAARNRPRAAGRTALRELDVPGLGPLVARLCVVGDLCALGERAITLTDDCAVMDEQVLRLVIGRDEPEALLVAEPLYGSSSHCFPPASLVLRTRRLLSKGYERWHCDVGRTAQP